MARKCNGGVRSFEEFQAKVKESLNNTEDCVEQRAMEVKEFPSLHSSL